MMVIDDDNDDDGKYVIVYICNSSSPMLQVGIQFLQQFNETDYYYLYFTGEKSLLSLGCKDQSSLSKVN